MNANELADKVRQAYEAFTMEYAGFGELLEAETMLRQQHAEIEALKSVVYWLKENRPEVWDDVKKWNKT